MTIIIIIVNNIIIIIDPGQSPRCFRNSVNIKLAEMTIYPVDPWKNHRAGELR